MRIIFGLIACILFLSSCHVSDSPQIDRKSDFLLGTLISVNIYDYGTADYSVVDECFDLIRDYEQIFSYSISDSELSVLNNSAYNNAVTVSNELFEIISESMYYCQITDGAFDIGIGKLIEIWDKAISDEIPPQYDDLVDFVGFRGYEHIVVDSVNKTIMYTDSRVSIHLGACAKGYLEDIALDFLKDNGVKSALLDFGGSICVLGDKNGTGFNVGITDPADTNDLIGKVEITDGCVVTSGNYRRFFMYNDIRFHHIIDSRTAYPAYSGVNGVSVFCDSAFKGDCLSTAAFVLGFKDASELLKSQSCGYVIVGDDSVETDGVILNG